MTSKVAGACGQGMVFSVNAPSSGAEEHSVVKMAAIKAQGKGFKIAAIVATAPVQEVASTVSINPGNVGAQATGAAPAAGQATVVPGQGTTGNGQECGCSCLCGAGSFPPDAGVGEFGGFLGMSG
jgi:hypothetical protein